MFQTFENVEGDQPFGFGTTNSLIAIAIMGGFAIYFFLSITKNQKINQETINFEKKVIKNEFKKKNIQMEKDNSKTTAPATKKKK